MRFDEYEREVVRYAKYPSKGRNMVFTTLGLAGEAGEVADKVKKVIRDHKGRLTSEAREAIRLELGDVLWYLCMCCHELGVTLTDVADANLSKTRSRRNRGTTVGSGDYR